MALSAGTKLGPYEIVEPIGAGGMGEVYRARDTRLERSVAIKVLPQHLSSDTERKRRFEREAKAISSLQHPHICVLHDVGHQDGVDFLVMEHLEGETLAIRLLRGALPSEQVLKIGMEVADALDKAHRQGVVHRDLKPGNIMLTKSGAKLLDFGLAKPTSAHVDAGMPSAAVTAPSAGGPGAPLTDKGVVVGTFQYMSPEQVEGKEADARSDIFALGTVLYEMATGKRAFAGKSRISVASAILEREPPPISSIQPLVPLALEHVVKTCLAKDPEERWQNAADVARELGWIREGGSQAGAAAVPAHRQKLGVRAGWIVAGLAVVALIVVGASTQRREPAPRPSVRSIVTAPEKAPFDAFSFALSPDGSKLAFVAGPASELWVRPLDSLTAQSLSETEGAQSPFWSRTTSTSDSLHRGS
jgi:serine/threonine protein kinase